MAQDGCNVGLHSLFRDVQMFGYFTVGKSIKQTAQHQILSLRQ
jgi:hypothetical protein